MIRIKKAKAKKDKLMREKSRKLELGKQDMKFVKKKGKI